MPVVSSIGADRDGQLFNVNADTLASHLAARLKSPRLVVAGATAGVFDGQGATIPQMTLEDIDALIASGGATAGMIAKLVACQRPSKPVCSKSSSRTAATPPRFRFWLVMDRRPGRERAREFLLENAVSATNE